MAEIDKIKTELAEQKAENDILKAQITNAEKERDDALKLLSDSGNVADVIAERDAAILMVEDLSKKLAIQESLGGERPTFELDGETYLVNFTKFMTKINEETVELTADDLVSKEEYEALRKELVEKGSGVVSKLA